MRFGAKCLADCRLLITDYRFPIPAVDIPPHLRLQSSAVQGGAPSALYYVFRVGAREYMKATYHPGVHKYALFVVCWTACLLTAGALVTSNDAALSVSDWPTSFGSYFPPLRLLTGGALIEPLARLLWM